MPISSVLATLVLAIQLIYGNWAAATIWFIIVNAINVTRIALALRELPPEADGNYSEKTTEGQFRQFRALALMSGLAWSFLAVLTNGYTTLAAPPFLIILAGISSGAVVYSKSYSTPTIYFVTTPLLIAAGCLIAKGSIENYILSFTVILYLAGLVRGSLRAETHFREASRLKHRAEQTAAEMEQNSRLDPLTGLLNRRGLEHAVQRLVDVDGRFVTMLIDLDGFKAVNDTYGHKTGDDVLTKIALKIKDEVAPGATLARIGGDEFVILIPDHPHLDASKLASSIIDSISRYDHDLASVQLGACIGIYISGRQSLTDMLLRADSALYSAKHRGRNEFCLFDRELESALQRRNCIERDLRSALEAKLINTWFQPIVNLETREVIGFEALLRWFHPVHGNITPPEIVTVARETGTLQLLTESVFSDCCKLIESLLKLGRPDVRVAMNVSPRELEAGNIDDLIVNGLRAKGLPSSMFEIEITEEAPVDPERVDAKLGNLSHAGISIALDDFGTGFSTLASLKDKRIAKVKIDKAFIRGLAESPKDQMLVKAVIDLGRSLGIDVMAEGVETETDRKTLQALGCRTAQGYLFARAMLPEAALALVADRRARPIEPAARYG